MPSKDSISAGGCPWMWTASSASPGIRRRDGEDLGGTSPADRSPPMSSAGTVRPAERISDYEIVEEHVEDMVITVGRSPAETTTGMNVALITCTAAT